MPTPQVTHDEEDEPSPDVQQRLDDMGLLDLVGHEASLVARHTAHSDHLLAVRLLSAAYHYHEAHEPPSLDRRVGEADQSSSADKARPATHDDEKQAPT